MTTPNYYQQNKALNTRIQHAWQDFSDRNNPLDTRRKALEFLIFALDIPCDNIRDHQEQRKIHATLTTLMPQIAHINTPLFLRENSARSNAEMNDRYWYYACGPGVSCDGTRSGDESRGARFFTTDDERAPFRVTIHNGKFYKGRYLADTEEYISHEKCGFAAYTLSPQGELSIFKHLHAKGKNPILHSSIHNSKNLLSAGELKIKNGKLLIINSHSGHYKPKLYQVYLTLKHFQDRGIDISKTKVHSFKNPDKLIQGKSKKITILHEEFYEFNATDLVDAMQSNLESMVLSFDKSLQSYQNSKRSMFFRLKDMMMGSSLTKNRHDVASVLRRKLKEVDLCDLQQAREQIKQLIEEQKNANKTLSEKSGKEPHSGRLMKLLQSIEQKLETQYQEPAADNVKIKAKSLS